MGTEAPAAFRRIVPDEENAYTVCRGRSGGGKILFDFFLQLLHSIFGASILQTALPDLMIFRSRYRNEPRNFDISFVGFSLTRREPFQKFSVAHEGQRGGLEIVFNQQLTRLGITSLAASLPQAQRWFQTCPRLRFLYTVTFQTRCSTADVGQLTKHGATKSNKPTHR